MRYAHTHLRRIKMTKKKKARKMIPIRNLDCVRSNDYLEAWLCDISLIDQPNFLKISMRWEQLLHNAVEVLEV